MQDATAASEWGGAGKVVFGAWPLIAGTLLTTGGAVSLAAILGMGCAIFLANLAPRWLARPVETVVRLLAGIPSVVFGLVGLTVIVPWIQTAFVSQDLANRYPDLSLTGESLLAGILVLAFMILPFFVSIATDSLRAVPESYRLGGLALGMTPWRAVTRLVVPPAIPGLVAGLVLASARAVGEAIALSMVAGAMSNVPSVAHGLVFFLEPVRTMASAIVEGGDSMQQVPQIQAALFGVATVLLAMSLVLSVTARAASASFAKRMHLISDRAS